MSVLVHKSVWALIRTALYYGMSYLHRTDGSIIKSVRSLYRIKFILQCVPSILILCWLFWKFYTPSHLFIFFFHPADSLHYLIYMCIIMFCISVHLFYKQFGNWCDKFIVYMYQIISCLFKLESKWVKAIIANFMKFLSMIPLWQVVCKCIPISFKKCI